MGLEMHEPELEMEYSEDYEDSMEDSPCGEPMEPQGQPAEPMMVMNGEDAYEIDDELANLMET